MDDCEHDLELYTILEHRDNMPLMYSDRMESIIILHDEGPPLSRQDFADSGYTGICRHLLAVVVPQNRCRAT